MIKSSRRNEPIYVKEKKEKERKREKRNGRRSQLDWESIEKSIRCVFD